MVGSHKKADDPVDGTRIGKVIMPRTSRKLLNVYVLRIVEMRSLPGLGREAGNASCVERGQCPKREQTKIGYYRREIPPAHVWKNNRSMMGCTTDWWIVHEIKGHFKRILTNDPFLIYINIIYIIILTTLTLKPAPTRRRIYPGPEIFTGV